MWGLECAAPCVSHCHHRTAVGFAACDWLHTLGIPTPHLLCTPRCLIVPASLSSTAPIASALTPTPHPPNSPQDMLDLAAAVKPNSRLGCQIYASAALDGMVLELPSEVSNLKSD